MKVLLFKMIILGVIITHDFCQASHNLLEDYDEYATQDDNDSVQEDEQVLEKEINEYAPSKIGALNISIDGRKFDIIAKRNGYIYRNEFSYPYSIINWDISIKCEDWPKDMVKNFKMQVKNGGYWGNKTLRVNNRVVFRSTEKYNMCVYKYGVKFCVKIKKKPKIGYKHKLLIMGVDNKKW